MSGKDTDSQGHVVPGQPGPSAVESADKPQDGSAGRKLPTTKPPASASVPGAGASADHQNADSANAAQPSKAATASNAPPSASQPLSLEHALEKLGPARGVTEMITLPRKQVYVACAVVGVMLCASLGHALWGASATPNLREVPEFPEGLLRQRVGDPDEHLREVLAYQAINNTQDAKDDGHALPRQLFHAPVVANAENADAPNKGKKPRKQAAVAVKAADVDPVAAAWVERFGSPERYAQANMQRRTPDQKPEKTADGARGAILPARLADDVTSYPVGAPVVAYLTRQVEFGDTQLPKGLEVHGIIRGDSSQSPRVFVDFTFARMIDGQTVDLVGTARDVRGRLGIPGERRLTKASAQSVVIASASRAAQAAGREMSNILGSVLGAGAEGAVESSTEKSKRMDADEQFVYVPRGSTFRIYLQEFGTICAVQQRP